MHISNYRQLNVWRTSFRYSVSVCKLSSNFPNYEQYGIGSQLRRSSVSVPSNIAEGFGRYNKGEKVQFYRIAHGSLLESQTQLLVAKELGYFKQSDYECLWKESESCRKLLIALIKSTTR